MVHYHVNFGEAGSNGPRICRRECIAPAIQIAARHADPDEPSINRDSAVRDFERRPDLRHVDIECGAVVGILDTEGGHPDRLRIPHLFEQGIEVRVVNRPQRHLSHKHPHLVQHRSAKAEHTSGIGRSVNDRHLHLPQTTPACAVALRAAGRC
jgi:hypothetical protein